MSIKFSIEKFPGKNNFGLWQLKISAFQVYQGLEEALNLSEKEKKDVR